MGCDGGTMPQCDGRSILPIARYTPYGTVPGSPHAACAPATKREERVRSLNMILFGEESTSLCEKKGDKFAVIQVELVPVE